MGVGKGLLVINRATLEVTESVIVEVTTNGFVINESKPNYVSGYSNLLFVLEENKSAKDLLAKLNADGLLDKVRFMHKRIQDIETEIAAAERRAVNLHEQLRGLRSSVWSTINELGGCV